MKPLRNAAVVAAIVGVSVIASLAAMDDHQPAPSAGQQPVPAGGPMGALPQDHEPRGQLRPGSDQRSTQSGYSEWESSPSGEWYEPAYGGWTPNPSGEGWGHESSATGEQGSQGQWGTPRSSGTPPPEQGASESPAAASPGRVMVNPWATTNQRTEPRPADEATEQPSSAANYPIRPMPPRAGAPPAVYGGYPGYAGGPPPPPPPGWGYGYPPGYGGPPGPYGGPGVARSGTEGGWPWGNMMPWGNRGGGDTPWGGWMPWSK